ncbi:MAG TPA: enoyl-CoA hydratase-related protein [Acidimicrobiia bacterium]
MPLHVEQQGRVRVLTLDDPERRNALTAALVDEIVAAVEAADADDEVGALVVTGAPPAFCSGADVGNLAALGAQGATRARGSDAGSLRGVYEGFLRVLRSPLPTVAAVNGAAVGAGFNLALACDLRIAARSARFDSRFLRLGIHPGGGHVWLLERAVGPQAAAAMLLFGERVDGERAAELGLAWRCVDDDAVLREAIALAERAAAVPREVATRAKATVREAPWQPDFEAAVTTELERQAWSFDQGYFSRS